MPLDATVGGSASNAYLTTVRATVLLADQLGIDAWYAELPIIDYPWQELEARRSAALIQGTGLLDHLVRWRGQPSTRTQALDWPQEGQVDAHGHPVDPTSIPLELEQATALYGLILLHEANQVIAGVPSGGAAVKRRRIGQTEIEYQLASLLMGKRPATQQVPAEVMALLIPYGVTSSVAIPLART